MYESIWTPLNILLVVVFIVTLLLVLFSKPEKLIGIPPRTLPPGIFPRPPIQGNVSSFVGPATPGFGAASQGQQQLVSNTAQPGAPPSPEPACDIQWNPTRIGKDSPCCSTRTDVQCAWDTVSDRQMTCQDVSTANKPKSFVCLPPDNNPRGATVISLSLDPGMKSPTLPPPVMQPQPAQAASGLPAPAPSSVPKSTPSLPAVPVPVAKPPPAVSNSKMAAPVVPAAPVRPLPTAPSAPVRPLTPAPVASSNPLFAQRIAALKAA